MNTKTLVRINTVLAAAVLILLVISHLALVDINKGIEADLSAEWWVVRITLILAACLALTSLITTRSFLHHSSKPDRDN